MALINVSSDPQPGDAGYYDWHDAVGDASNKLKSALDAGSEDDLVGVDANSEPKHIPSRTFAKARDTDVTVTVGSGGDHATINAALEALSRYHPVFKAAGITAEIRLLAGFVMSEQVYVEPGRDYSWIILASDDWDAGTKVTIDRSALTDTIPRRSAIAAFHAGENSSLPVIDARFVMDTSGTANDQYGFDVQSSVIVFRANAGLEDAPGRNLHVHNGTRFYAADTNFSGAGSVGVRVGNDSHGTVRRATVDNCGFENLGVGSGCSVVAQDGSFQNGGSRGVNATGPALVTLYNSTVSGVDHDIRAIDGAIIQRHRDEGGGVLTGHLTEPMVKAATRLSDALAFDTFSRADGSLDGMDTEVAGTTSDALTWTVHTGTLSVASGQVTASPTGVASVATSTAEVEIDVTIREAATARSLTGPAFRVIDGSNYLYVRISGSDVRLIKHESGSDTDLATGAHSDPIDSRRFTLKAIIRGGNVQVFKDGHRVIQHVLSAGDQTTFGGVQNHGIKVRDGGIAVDDVTIRAA